MTNQQPKIFVGKCRGGYAIFAGASKLSTAFKTPELCQAEYDKNDTMYQHWAGSASVSIENTTPVIISLY
jgi:hypothetical protein